MASSQPCYCQRRADWCSRKSAKEESRDGACPVSRCREKRRDLVQLEPNRLGKFPLLLIEAIKVVHAQLKGRCHVQKVRRSGAEFRGSLPRQLACPLKKRFLQTSQLQGAIAQVFLEVS